MDLTKKGGKVRIRNMGDDDHGIKCSGRCLSITRRGMVMRSQGGRCTNNCREVKEAAGTGKHSRVASLKPGLCQIKITGLTRHSLYPQRIWPPCSVDPEAADTWSYVLHLLCFCFTHAHDKVYFIIRHNKISNNQE